MIHKQRDAKFVESHSALLAVVEQLHGVDDDVLARLDHVITTSSLTSPARNSQEIDLTLQLSQVFDQLSNLTGESAYFKTNSKLLSELHILNSFCLLTHPSACPYFTFKLYAIAGVMHLYLCACARVGV